MSVIRLLGVGSRVVTFGLLVARGSLSTAQEFQTASKMGPDGDVGNLTSILGTMTYILMLLILITETKGIPKAIFF